MNTKQTNITFIHFMAASLLAVIAIIMKERIAFFFCAGVADILGIILVANIIKRRRVL